MASIVFKLVMIVGSNTPSSKLTQLQCLYPPPPGQCPLCQDVNPAWPFLSGGLGISPPGTNNRIDKVKRIKKNTKQKQKTLVILHNRVYDL